jgi:hypothetical protein
MRIRIATLALAPRLALAANDRNEVYNEFRGIYAALA